MSNGNGKILRFENHYRGVLAVKRVEETALEPSLLETRRNDAGDQISGWVEFLRFMYGFEFNHGDPEMIFQTWLDYASKPPFLERRFILVMVPKQEPGPINFHWAWVEESLLRKPENRVGATLTELKMFFWKRFLEISALF